MREYPLPQAQGIAAAKGTALGRPKVIYPDNWDEVYNLERNTAKEAMERLDLKRNTSYKLAAQCEASYNS